MRNALIVIAICMPPSALADETERSTEDILADYQAILDFTPSRPTDYFRWSFNYALSNAGAEDDANWQHQLSIYAEDDSPADSSLSLHYATAEFSGEHDFSIDYQRALSHSDTGRHTWYIGIAGSLVHYDASKFEDDTDYFNETTSFTPEILSLYFPSRSVSIATRFAVDFDSIDQDTDFINITTDAVDQNTNFIDLVNLNNPFINQIIRDSNDPVIQVRNYVNTVGVQVGQNLLIPDQINAKTVDAEESFVVPNISITIDRWTSDIQSSFYIQLSKNISDADAREVEKLGRFDTNEEYQLINYATNQSINLGSRDSRHGIAFNLGGQYSFGDRVMPQAQMSLGGSGTVRGYDSQILSTDEATFLQLEYFVEDIFVRNTAHSTKLAAFMDYARALNFSGTAHAPGNLIIQEPLARESYKMLSIGFGFNYTYRSQLFISMSAGRVLKDLHQIDEISSLVTKVIEGAANTETEIVQLAEKGDTALHLDVNYRF